MKAKWFILCMFSLLVNITANAYDAEIDGIYYNFSGSTATVTFQTYSYNSYSGDVVIPESVEYNGSTYSVTSIGNNAFRGCSRLTSVTIPNSVTSIGDYVFSGCSGLTSVAIPNSVTSIGSDAFSGCSGLRSVAIPNSVTSIGSDAFSGCSGLRSVNISDLGSWCNISFGNLYANPLNYAHRLFLNGVEVADLVIPNSVTSIGNSAFSGCSGLTSIEIPNSVTSIGNSAFYKCSGLTSVTIGNSVTSIGDDAFQGCSGLTSIEIPNSVTSIGNYAFQGCSGLTSVAIPNSVTSIGGYAFQGCSGLTSVAIPNSVTSIGGYAFQGCSSLTSIEIPNSVTSIGNSAFRGCSGLTSIEIPNSVTSIGNSAFSGCSGLTSVNISDLGAWCNISFGTEDANPLYYAHHLFLNGVEVADLVIPNSVTSISNNAFRGCSGLTSVTIPNSVTSIGSDVFAGCSSLMEISVDDNNTNYCSLDGVLMNKNRTSIIAFPEAKESYILPASVTSLNPSILGSNIKSFQIADSGSQLTLTGENTIIQNIYIGRNIILSSNYSPLFPNVESAEFGNNVTTIEKNLFSYRLKSVTIPSSVTTINSYAFSSCKNLKTVNYLGTINQWLKITFSSNPLHNGAALYLNGSPASNLTFANVDGTVGTQLRGCTNLKSVTIASGNTLIEQYAFYGCISLEAITVPSSVTTVNDWAFSNCNNLKAVYYDGTLGNWYAMTLKSNPLSLGADMYLNNTLLTNAVIPSSVTKIGTQLSGCTSLKTVTISAGTTTISNAAFRDCKSLTSVSIPSTVTTIDSYSFGYCISLTNVTIPSSVTNLSDYAFYGCSSLQNINFSGSTNYTTIDGVVYDKDVTKIISYPQGKTSTSYTYPSTITTFGGIRNNPYLERIIVPELSTTPDYITPSSFNAGPNLLSVEFEDSIKSSSYSYYTRDGVVYRYYYSTYNNKVSNSLLFCPRGKTSLTVKPDVTYLYVDGFSGESKLESLVVEPSDSYLSFGEYSSGVSSSNIKYFHSPLREVHLGRGGISKDGLFAEIPTLETVVIGENMTSIPSSLFNGCTGLTQVTLPETITSVGTNAFYNTPWLASLPMQDGIRYYNYLALEYEYPENTKNVRLKEGTSVIAGGLFKGSNVESVAIPISVTSLPSSLFNDCTRFKKVILPNSIKQIPNSMSCGAVENIHVPGSVTWIGRYAINECDTVVIEDGNNMLQLQDRNADDGYWHGVFSGVKKLYVGCNTDNGSSSQWAGQTFTSANSSSTQLTEITFGPLVTRAFWDYDFSNCDKVKSVTCLAKQPFSSPAFWQIPQTAVLYVPLGSGDSYASAGGWSSFSSIEEVTSVTITMDDTEKVYAGDFDLDFSEVDGLKAYVAGDFDPETSTITLVPAQLVSAGKGVILKGAKGTYTVPCANIEPTAADPLCGTISGRFIRNTEGESVNYAFDKHEHVFKRVDAIYGCLLSRNEAYLSLPASSVSTEIIETRVYSPTITFADDAVKALCVANWDTSGDGELSEAEAAAVSNLGEVFKGNTEIESFNELQYFIGLTNIGNGAFDNCTGLTSVTIPTGVTSIGSHAFYCCRSLTSVTIPNSVTSIGSDVFSVCSSLSSIIVEGGNPKYDSRSNCNAIIETSTNSLIAGCMSTVIPNGITSIGFAAFSGHSGLTSVTIPNSVTSIESFAFYESGLTFVKVNLDNPQIISWGVFYGCYNATLIVPVGHKIAYQAANYWKEFKRIIEDIDGDVNGDGESDVLDVVDIARYVVGTPAETFVPILADINNNGEVNIADAVCLVNDIAGDQNFAKPNRAPKHNAANETLLLTTDNENYLSLALQNERDYTAFQFDLYVPDETDVTQMLLNAQRKQKHQLLYNKVEDGHWRVAALSTSNRTFLGNDGELLSVVYDGIMNDEVAIRNIHFFTADGSDYQFDDISLGGTTAIHSLNNGKGANVGSSTVYDMQGRKIMSGDSSNRQLPKGLYIINGKKVVIK